MKILNSNSWLRENKDKYPNGCNIDKVMDAYAKYYHEAMIKNNSKTEKND